MSSLTPISREVLLTLKAKKDEEIRQEKVNGVLEHIYGMVIKQAETSVEPLYKYRVPLMGHCRFHIENMTEIIRRLAHLFVNCKVYISTEPTFPNGMYVEDFIVIDWTT